MKIIGLMFFGIIVTLNVNSQIIKGENIYPEVGKPCPDFVLKDVKNYYRKKVTLSDFKGKWIVLDFWAEKCLSCIESLPKMNEIQKTYKDDVQFMMVGLKDDGGEVETIFAKYKTKLNLEIPTAFESDLFKQFDIGGLPFIIVIDPQGIVRGITSYVNSKIMEDFLLGNQPVLSKAYREHEVHQIKYNSGLPLLVQGNGGNDTNFLYRSLLSKWTALTPIVLPNSVKLENGRFELLGANPNKLYMYAYFGKSTISGRDSLYGKVWPRPILELHNESDFQFDMNQAKNIYCYSLALSPIRSRTVSVREVFQSELKNFFGYDVVYEIRKMPYWRLLASEKARNNLRTKGGPFISSGGKVAAGFTAKNYSMKDFLVGLELDDIPVIDETGIIGNIDITMDCIMTDSSDMRRGLRLNGLDLVKGEKEMKVIVIRDSL
jgi:thiol-disulfide isomerase/thioredoxin